MSVLFIVYFFFGAKHLFIIFRTLSALYLLFLPLPNLYIAQALVFKSLSLKYFTSNSHLCIYLTIVWSYLNCFDPIIFLMMVSQSFKLGLFLFIFCMLLRYFSLMNLMYSLPSICINLYALPSYVLLSMDFPN